MSGDLVNAPHDAASTEAPPCPHERCYSFMQGNRLRSRCRDCGSDVEQLAEAATFAPDATTATGPASAIPPGGAT